MQPPLSREGHSIGDPSHRSPHELSAIIISMIMIEIAFRNVSIFSLESCGTPLAVAANIYNFKFWIYLIFLIRL